MRTSTGRIAITGIRIITESNGACGFACHRYTITFGIAERMIWLVFPILRSVI